MDQRAISAIGLERLNRTRDGGLIVDELARDACRFHTADRSASYPGSFLRSMFDSTAIRTSTAAWSKCSGPGASTFRPRAALTSWAGPTRSNCDTRPGIDAS